MKAVFVAKTRGTPINCDLYHKSYLAGHSEDLIATGNQDSTLSTCEPESQTCNFV